MRFRKMTSLGVLAAGLVYCADTAIAQGDQRPLKAGKESKSSNPFGGSGDEKQAAKPIATIRVYNVSDLLTAPPDYPYEPGLPTTERAPAASGLGGFGGAGSGFGGRGGGDGQTGGGGAGFFAVPSSTQLDRASNVHHQFGGGGGMGGGLGGGPVNSSEVELDNLVSLIIDTISSMSWGGEDTSGQTYDIKPFKQMLIVRQTVEVHEQIEAFLQELREQSGSNTMLTVRVHWLPVETLEALKEIQQEIDSTRGGNGITNQFEDLLQSADYRGEITCHSGQTVHLASGARRMVIRGATPSVGFGSAAYTPEVAYPHIGTIVQVKPSLQANGKTVAMNLWSTVTEWREPGEPVQLTAEFNRVKSDQGETGGGEAKAMIDRVNLQTRHLATSIRLPLNTPTLVGTLTGQETTSDKEKASIKQFALIVQVTAVESE